MVQSSLELLSFFSNCLFCVSALCDSRDVSTGDGPARGAGNERPVPAATQQQRQPRTGAPCVLQRRTAEALWSRARFGQQRKVAPGRLLPAGAPEPMAEGQAVRPH